MKKQKTPKGYKAYRDDNGNVVGYTKRDLWGSVKFYDQDLNLLDESGKSFLRLPKRDGQQ